ncbi:MAG: hypothetical protein HC838_05405 [Spirulinaceae cyanobacterium RM2_2_10]|nr:hypothetical protein [Spirulinaceae cyanobacterium SM2_1_0]NJO19602.1 hypothetical protein [Spirulinaceae cyanobacterium RM2_2_10]
MMPRDRSLADYYQLLELPPDATAADVDVAYLRITHQRLRSGEKSDLPALKQARSILKSALQQREHERASTQQRARAQAATPVALLQDRLATWSGAAQVKIRGRSLHVALPTGQVPHPLLATAKVYTLVSDCLATAPELAKLKRLHIYGWQANKKPRWQRQLAMPTTEFIPADFDLLSFQNRYSNVFFFPGLMALAMLLKAWAVSSFLLRGIDVWLHEFGHATIAWLSGRKAIPLPLGWTSIEVERSLFVYFGLLALFGLLFWAGRREQRRWPMVLAIAFALLQFVMTWLLSADTFEMLTYFGGIGGEFYLSTLLIVSFYFPMPDYWQWSFWRYPAALAAAFTFWGNCWQWRQIRRGLDEIPWGSLWGGRDHAGGDMNMLSNTFGWSDRQIIGSYNFLATLCLITILAIYAWRALWLNQAFLWASWQRFLARFA